MPPGDNGNSFSKSKDAGDIRLLGCCDDDGLAPPPPSSLRPSSSLASPPLSLSRDERRLLLLPLLASGTPSMYWGLCCCLLLLFRLGLLWGDAVAAISSCPSAFCGTDSLFPILTCYRQPPSKLAIIFNNTCFFFETPHLFASMFTLVAAGTVSRYIYKVLLFVFGSFMKRIIGTFLKERIGDFYAKSALKVVCASFRIIPTLMDSP